MDKISLKITRKIDGLTIKEYLKSMHVGRGKIEEIRVNKSAYLNNEQVNLETPLKEGDILTFWLRNTAYTDDTFVVWFQVMKHKYAHVLHRKALAPRNLT